MSYRLFESCKIPNVHPHSPSARATTKRWIPVPLHLDVITYIVLVIISSFSVG